MSTATLSESPESPVATLPDRSFVGAIGHRFRTFGRAPRLLGIDVARGLAVLGMIGAHIGVTETFDWARIETWTDLVHGRSSILFAVVAGISVALMSGGRRTPTVGDLPRLRLRLLGRAGAIFVIGLALEFLNTNIAVILTVYAVLFVVIMPFLRWRRRWLVTLAAALALFGPALVALLRVVSLNASSSAIDFTVFGVYPITVWLTFMLAGLAIGRTDLRRTRNAAILLLVGGIVAACGYGLAAITASVGGAEPVGGSSSSSSPSSGAPGGLVPGEEVDLTGEKCILFDGTSICGNLSGFQLTGGDAPEGSGGPAVAPYFERLAEATPVDDVVSALVASEPHSGGTLEILGSGGLAIAIVGVCLLIARPLRYVVYPFAALGSMPLTAYAAHVVSVVFIAGVAGNSADNTAWIASAVVGLIACTLWVGVVGQGPLERLTAAVANRAARGTAP